MLVKNWNKRRKVVKGRRGKIKSLCRIMIVYFKCKRYFFEVNIVLSVKLKLKLYEWKESKGFEFSMDFLNFCGKFDGLFFFL